MWDQEQLKLKSITARTTVQLNFKVRVEYSGIEESIFHCIHVEDWNTG